MNKKLEKGRILVTGGAGYIGSHTVIELLKEGFKVLIADNFCTSDSRIIKRLEEISGQNVPYREIDCCNEQAVHALLDEFSDVTAIIHFAALKAVGESVENPLLYYRNNIGALVSVLRAAQLHKISRFVFSSSCTVYGQPEHLPVTESSPIRQAESPYGQTKQMGEQILKDAATTGKSKVISLRYFNPIGAHESATIGELPIGKPNNLVPMITQTAVGIRKDLKIYGTDYQTPDGSCIRDFIHVTDVAKAHVKAIEKLEKDGPESTFQAFNLGTGKGYSVLETIKTFEEVSGQALKYSIAPRRGGDVEQVYADTSIANKELNWKAEKDLKEMLLSAWKWQLALTKNPL